MNTTKKCKNGLSSPPVGTDDSADAKKPAPRERTRTRPAVHDSVLGTRRAEVTHWSCWRIDRDSGQKGTRLLWSDGSGVESNEWPIETLKPAVLLERWGSGRYVVQYLKITAEGRKPWGRSRIFRVAAPASAKPAAPAPLEEPKPPAPPLAAALVGQGAPGQEAMLSQVFSILAFLEERGEKARERVMAEAKLNNERYKIEVDQLLERERIASKERVAIIESQSRRPAPRADPIDQEALALRIRDLVDESVRDALEEQEPDEEPPPPAPAAPPPDQGTAIVMAVKDVLQPILPLILANLAPKKPPGSDGNGGYGGGGDGGSDGGSGNDPSGGSTK